MGMHIDEIQEQELDCYQVSQAVMNEIDQSQLEPTLQSCTQGSSNKGFFLSNSRRKKYVL